MLKFYQNQESKQVVISREELNASGLVELKVASVDAAKEKHVPVVTKKCKQVKVDVGSVTHPMSAEHFIEWIAIETAQGYQIKYLTPESAPVASFSLADGDAFVAAYAYCNLHGVWQH